jgi:phage N-6-adenine-methyltransferase
MTAPLATHLNEIASTAATLRSALCGAISGLLRGENIEGDLQRAALLADMVARSAGMALEAPAPGMSQPMKLMTSNASDEWYTPPWVLQLARDILGGIDLDPASSEQANRAVQAHCYYTAADDGYMRPWTGRVWLNPPFSDTARWARRLAAAYQDGDVAAGLLLVNSAPGYTWYEELVDRWPAAQFRKRLAFVRGDGAPAGLAKKSQTLFYFGPDAARFFRLMESHARPLVTKEAA